jgi:hypothetical protein
MRRLYWAFLLAFAVMLLGFWPSFTGAFGPLDPMREVHGALAVTWMVLLVVQSWLIGHGHNRWHRWIGRTALVIVPALIISAFVVIHDMLGPHSHFSSELRLTLVWIDIWSLPLFGLLFVLALVYRRTMFLHSRFMASTVFIALIPALGRLYGMNIPALDGLRGALNPSFLTVEIVLAGLALRDGLKGRWLTPWWVTLGALAAIQLTMFHAPHWPWFLGVARMMGLSEG